MTKELVNRINNQEGCVNLNLITYYRLNRKSQRFKQDMQRAGRLDTKKPNKKKLYKKILNYIDKKINYIS